MLECVRDETYSKDVIVWLCSPPRRALYHQIPVHFFVFPLVNCVQCQIGFLALNSLEPRQY